MSGTSYRCVATNAEGTLTSSAATIEVFTPLPVTNVRILRSPVGTIPYGGNFQLDARYRANGEPGEVTYQWYKDGVPFSTGQTISKLNATPADSGSYTVIITNPGGSVSSLAEVITVASLIPASIVNQPTGLDVEGGLPFTLTATAAGSLPLNYQWSLNGQPIAGATGPSYLINAATGANGGIYTLTVTNEGGSVSTTPVNVNVLSGALPRITSPAAFYGGVVGPDNPNLTLAIEAIGAKPLAYQWYKNGAAIPGAVSSTYSKYPVTEADAGVYTVEVSNLSGVVLSPPNSITWQDLNATTPWLDSHRLGTVVYFLAAAPGRIFRYDLVQETWLPTVTLTPGVDPTGFLPTAEGTFIAYGSSVVRRSSDLQTETAVATATTPVSYFFAHGSLVYFISAPQTYSSYNRVTLASGPSGPALDALSWDGLSTVQPVISEATGTGYTSQPYVYPNDLVAFSFDSSGAISSSLESPYHGDFSIGVRRFVSPDGTRVFDSGGTVYDGVDLTYAGSLGSGFSHLVFLADGSLVTLKDKRLVHRATSSLVKLGESELSVRGLFLASHANALFVFSAPGAAASQPVVTKVPVSAFGSKPGTSALDPTTTRLSVDDAFIDDAGVVHVVSRVLHGIARWDTATHAFLPSLPLHGDPVAVSYAPTSQRLVLAYPEGELSEFNFGVDSTERVFGGFSYSTSQTTVVAMNDLTLVNIFSPGFTNAARLVVDSTGSPKFFDKDNTYGDAQTWDSVTRRLYTNSSQSWLPAGIDALVVPASGILPASFENSLVGTPGMLPLRLSATSSEALALTGKILSKNLTVIGDLGTVVADGVWLPDGLYTIRTRADGTQIQHWSRSGYGQLGEVTIAGKPVRLFRVADDRLVVVTLVNGYLASHLVPTSLTQPEVFLSNPDTGAPVITKHPAPKTANVGDIVTFAITSVGTNPVSYRWQASPTGTGGWADLGPDPRYAGFTTATLTVTAATGLEGVFYRCVVTNPVGTASSLAARLTVAPTAVSIIAQPSSVTTTAGGVAIFSIQATGSAPLSYQWQFSPATAGSWANLTDYPGAAGSNSATLAVIAAADLAGHNYRCVVSNALSSATSAAATLTVSATTTPPSIAIQPVPATVSVGATATFTVTASGSGPPQYRWQFAPSGSAQWQDVTNAGLYAGATSSALSVTGAVELSGDRFRCVVANAAGATISGEASLTVAEAPTVFLLSPQRQVVAPRRDAKLSISAVGAGPFTFQWYRNGRPIAGGVASNLALTNVTLADAGYYFADVTNEFGTRRSAAMFVLVAPANTRAVGWGYNGQPFDYSFLTDSAGLSTGSGPVLGITRDGHVASAATAGTVPAGWTEIVDIAVNNRCALALRSNGTVVAWGDNGFGTGAVPNGLSDVVAISLGWYHAMALKSDGTVVTWGAVGVPTVAANVQPPVGIRGVEIATSFNGSAILKADGTVLGWGGLADVGLTGITSFKATEGTFGLRSDGTAIFHNPPYGWPGAVENVATLWSYGDHGLALKRDGTVVAWGRNLYGENAVPSSLANAIAISGGERFSVALVDTSPANDLTLIGYSFPDRAGAGNRVRLGVTFRNSGTSTWNAGYSLVLKDVAGNAVTSVRLGNLVPGQEASESLSFIAPLTAGSYSYRIQAAQLGAGSFGPEATFTLEVVIPHRSDFNRDGKPDLIWSNSKTGERALWLMNGTNFLAASTLGIFPLEWTVAATGDFNGDGKPDLIWSNSITGERALWLMNGTNLLGVSTLGIFPLEWTVAATADFNADGNPDVIWSNSLTGERAIWLMNGTNFLAASTLGVFPLEWTVAATGDFNADNKPDLVWSNSVNGERALWLMDGTTRIGVSTLGTFPLEWTVAGTADFNADGKPDIIWSNSITGERALWLMNGTNFLAASTLGIFPLEWTVSN